MSKIAINNEIVLMRQAVRQARVAVVRKLIKEAKLLQARKHGDEKTIEKCKRKGQRLVAEIAASKKIKDDDITRFAITNTRKLAEVLNDSTCEPATRIMCRLTFHKILADRVAKFKEKLPEYEEHLGPGRKKLSKIQRQANRETRNAMKRNPGINADGDKVTKSEEEARKSKAIDENVAERSDESDDEEDVITEDAKEAATSSDSDGEVDSESNFMDPAESKINEADEEDSSPGRKKLSKIQRQANRKARKATERNPEADGAVGDKATNSKGEGSEEEAQKNQTGSKNVLERSDESGNEEDRIAEDSKEATESSDSDGEVDSKINFTEPAESKINEADEDESEEMNTSTSKHGSEPGSILRIKTQSSEDKGEKREEGNSVTKDSTEVKSEKAKSNKSKKDKKTKSIKDVDEETTKKRVSAPKASAEPKKPKPIKVISREASVKRFTELGEAKESEEIVHEPETVGSSKRREVKVEKEVDSFFMTENGESEYLSVVVPKSKLCEDDVEDERFSQNHAAKRQMNFHERNNKFFSKIDQRVSGGGYGDKYASNIAGRKRSINLPNWEGGPAKKFGREGSGPGRNARANFEKKIEPKDEVLHPSWAARKKQQEILKQGFQGKKIVFDD